MLTSPTKLLLNKVDMGFLRRVNQLITGKNGNNRNYASELNVFDYTYLTGSGPDNQKRREIGLQGLSTQDRYQPRIYYRIPISTIQQPNLVHAQAGEDKVVGCLCEKDSMHVNYWIIKNDGKVRRCECNHWFKVVDEMSLG